ncbi:MAG: sigma-70 family RNA polymerase sigma factor [Solirubrobacteraceae bacterium]|jgi:RNA polymerase sigma factor (sigma-70 family)
MELQTLFADEQAPLVSRLTFALGGDRHAAEDLAQETLIRAWQRLPAGLDEPRRRAWVSRTARNLLVDELRRRTRRPIAPALDLEASHAAAAAAEPDAAREALAQLEPHQRFVLLLRFEAGFTHAEIGAILGTGEEAARKRVARARGAFLRAYRSARSGDAPLILLVIREDNPTAYVRWLERAGANVRQLRESVRERDLLLADGIVFSGAGADIDPGLYGETPRRGQGESDLASDRTDLAALNVALAADLPIVGVCRGGQLLNIASGGSLYQDVIEDGLTPVAHSDVNHVVHTTTAGFTRRLLGRTAHVKSSHHQAARRVGKQLRVTGHSPDGVIESLERIDRRFVLGLQWHPEQSDPGPGAIVAEAFIDAARERAA